jgi:copper chaperone CopZ
MKKVFRLNNLDCANCAAKMEAAIGKLDGVAKATVSFMTQRLTIECEEKKLDSILTEAKQIIQKIEPDCQLIG